MERFSLSLRSGQTSDNPDKFVVKDYFNDEKFKVTEIVYYFNKVTLTLGKLGVRISFMVNSLNEYQRLRGILLNREFTAIERNYDEKFDLIIIEGVNSSTLYYHLISKNNIFSIDIINYRKEKIWKHWELDNEDNYIQWLPEEVLEDVLVIIR